VAVETSRRICHETNQKETEMKTLSIVAITAFAFLASANFASAQDRQDDKFQVSSTTFKNNSILPIIVIHNNVVKGSNVCSINGAPGGNESPELSWTDVPRGTASFVVITFDTLGFTHWGMYNIPPTITKLPENAGVAGSAYGQQVVNVDDDLSYDGPCPPPNFPPNVHDYVFTVYALDQELELPSSTNFPATADTLFHALVEAGEHGHILASASITGLYSTTPE
jgi:Raf kinase inhibitor-like YbhB/YbcL family protein